MTNAWRLEWPACLGLVLVLTACSTGGGDADLPLTTMPYEKARGSGHPLECNFTLKGLFGDPEQYHSQVLGSDFWVEQITDADTPGTLPPDELLSYARVGGTGYAWMPGALKDPERYPHVPYRFDMGRVLDAYREATGETALQTPFFFVMPQADTPCNPIERVDMHLPPSAASFGDLTDEVVETIRTMRP